MSRKIRTVEDLWSEPIMHGCHGLRQCAIIPQELRTNYRSLRPIHCVPDYTSDEIIHHKSNNLETLSKRAYVLFTEYYAIYSIPKTFISDLDLEGM